MWDLIKEKRLNKNSKTRKIRNCGFGAQIFFLKKKTIFNYIVRNA